MLCYGLNFWLKFRLLPLFFLFAVFVSGQKIPVEGELNELENQVLGIFRPDSFPPRLDSAGVQPPNVDIPKVLFEKLRSFGEFAPFTPTLRKHNDLANELTKVFLNVKNVEDVQSIGKYLYGSNINRGLLVHALSVALMHRPDSRDFRVGKLFQMLTSDYLDGRLVADIVRVAEENDDTDAVDIWKNYTTASNREPEHRIAYFREDIGINLHHWHWHLVYPYNGPDRIVKKHRRGELFYFMHQQIIARYDAERLSNQLSRVKRLNNLKEPIAEAYFSKLDSHLASRSWPSRASGMTLRDIDRPDDSVKFDIQDLERWANRLYEAIYTRKITYSNGTVVPLDERTGIDILGNAIEASPNLSPNIDYYGELHNNGHNALALIHDPDGSHLESFSVMGDPATAMRDPVFYRWHSWMNEIFLDHKNTLTPYTVKELGYPGIEVSDVHVVEDRALTGEKNHLNTFWDWSVIKLVRGVDFVASRGSKPHVKAAFTHLNHYPFSYKFTINNTSPGIKTGLVRIFMAPKFDERGLPFPFDEQKKLMMDMDIFRISIPRGVSPFVRSSIDSSLTIPFSSSIEHLTVDEIPVDGEYSGCGWPQHMLLPRGTKDGFPMDLFLMVSLDPVEDVYQPDGSRTPAFTFCGIRDRNYPGARSMGYPFDRKVNRDTDTLSKFLLPNMATTTIKVQFTDDFLGELPVKDVKSERENIGMLNTINRVEDKRNPYFQHVHDQSLHRHHNH